jgi:hypothetical protein
MDQASFWKLIATARSGARDDQTFLQRMAVVLAKLSPDELREYDRHFGRLHAESYSLKLWGAAYLTNGGCSDDGFEYFRAWLIAQGQTVFERANENPDSLAEIAISEAELEEFWYLARQIHLEKTGKEMPHERVARPALGEEWDFDDSAQMKSRYPKLFAKYVGVR